MKAALRGFAIGVTRQKLDTAASVRRLLELQLWQRGLILRHAVVDFVGPGADAAFDALDVFEALFAQELKGA